MLSYGILVLSVVAAAQAFAPVYDGRIFGVDNQQKLEKIGEEFVGTISIGTPAQDLNVVYSTESSALWVPNSGCPCKSDCNIGDERLCYTSCKFHCCSKENEDDEVGLCSNKNVYDPEQSKTHVARVTLLNERFQGVSTNLTTAYDTLHFGPSYKTSHSAHNILFGHTSNLPKAYNKQKADGVFGLGRTTVEGAKAPIQQLAENGAIPAPLVTLSFPGNEGFVSLGQIDETYCDIPQENSFETIAEESWKLGVTVAYFAGKTYQRGYTATINSDLPHLYVPPSAFNWIKGSLTYHKDTDKYTVSCRNGKSLLSSATINIRGVPFSIPMADMLVDQGIDLCEVNIRSSGDEHGFVLGKSFLKQRCVVLDYNGYVAIADSRKFKYN